MPVLSIFDADFGRERDSTTHGTGTYVLRQIWGNSLHKDEVKFSRDFIAGHKKRL
jgi:hypothetical protein